MTNQPIFKKASLNAGIYYITAYVLESMPDVVVLKFNRDMEFYARPAGHDEDVLLFTEKETYVAINRDGLEHDVIELIKDGTNVKVKLFGKHNEKRALKLLHTDGRVDIMIVDDALLLDAAIYSHSTRTVKTEYEQVAAAFRRASEYAA